MDLRQLQASPAAFRDALLIDADGQPKRLGAILDPWQREDFARLDPGWAAVATGNSGGGQRAWLERPRGHSNTADLAVMSAWVLFASRRTLRGYAAAADRDQSRLLRDAIETLVRLNPWLARILKVDSWKIANTRTGSTLEILSSDAPTSYGLTPDFVICDEIVHWQRRDLWDSLISAAAKRARCMVVVISNAGFGESWQWETREAVRQDPAWLFSRLDGPLATWITPDRLAEQRRLLPNIAYRRLWLNQWTSGSGDALQEDEIARAITQPGPLSAAEPGWAYVAGLDLGLSRDAAALACVGVHVGHSVEIEKPAPVLPLAAQAMVELGIADPPDVEPEYEEHPGTGRLRLARLALWRPRDGAGGKVEIEEIEQTIADWHQRFNLCRVGADPWQAAYLVERLAKRGIPTGPVDQTGNNLKSQCGATLEAFSAGNIDLYDDPQLLADLRGLRVVEKSYGCRLESPRGPAGHGDSATALAIALHLLRNSAAAIASCAQHGKLIIAG